MLCYNYISLIQDTRSNEASSYDCDDSTLLDHEPDNSDIEFNVNDTELAELDTKTEIARVESTTGKDSPDIIVLEQKKPASSHPLPSASTKLTSKKTKRKFGELLRLF